MWAVSFLAFLANPLVGGVLLLSAAITTGFKVAKVDAEYAKQGKTPPTAALIEKWLDQRAAKGAKPKKAKPYGSWAYAKQRWQAMWEDLGEKHREQRAEYKRQVAEARKNGTAPPSPPKLKDRLAGWKWSVDALVRPAGERKPEQPDSRSDQDDAGLAADGPVIACDECGTRLIDTSGGYRHPDDSACPKAAVDPAASPSKAASVCPRCRESATVTPSGWCEPCTLRGPHGFCPKCNGAVRLENGQWVHDPNWKCSHREPAAGHTAFCAGGCGKRLTMHPSLAALGMQVHCRDCRTAGPVPDGPDGWEDPRVRDGHAHEAVAAHEKRGRQSDWTFTCPHGCGYWTGGDTQQEAQAKADAHKPVCPDRPQTGGKTPESTSNPEGDTMTTAPTQQSGEVVGLTSAINYADAVAQAHAAHSQGGDEQYRASLGQAKVGPETIKSAARAQELSAMAAAAWKAHADKLREQLAAKEHTTAETGSKDFLLSE